MEHLILEDNMRDQIQVILKEWLESTETNALEELEKLIKDEQRSPMTYNHYYTDNIQKSRLDVITDAVQKAVREERTYSRSLTSFTIMNPEDLPGAVESHITTDMDEQACNNATIELQAYYKVKLRCTLIRNLFYTDNNS